MAIRCLILLALILGCCSISLAEETVEIPLSKIWALRMPGTKNVEGLEAEHYGQSQHGLTEEKKFEHLVESLSHKIPAEIKEKSLKGSIGSSFVVEGAGKEALENVLKALKSSPAETVTSAKAITLIFYSRPYGSYVQLEHVAQLGKKITISFTYKSHATKDMTSHFALIPLGKLSPGKYDVEIVPDNKRNGIVSGPFSFSVE